MKKNLYKKEKTFKTNPINGAIITRYKGKEKTRYETVDMSGNKEELYNDLKELNERMGVEIKRIGDIEGRLKAFVIFE